MALADSSLACIWLDVPWGLKKLISKPGSCLAWTNALAVFFFFLEPYWPCLYTDSSPTISLRDTNKTKQNPTPAEGFEWLGAIPTQRNILFPSFQEFLILIQNLFKRETTHPAHRPLWERALLHLTCLKYIRRNLIFWYADFLGECFWTEEKKWFWERKKKPQNKKPPPTKTSLIKKFSLWDDSMQPWYLKILFRMSTVLCSSLAGCFVFHSKTMSTLASC